MPDPMYRQIADVLQPDRVGDLAPGVQLKTEMELREHHKASRNTFETRSRG